MRVDFSTWYADQSGLVARKYSYSQMEGMRDFDLEVHFNIEAGLSIYTFANFLISEVDLPNEMALRGLLSEMDTADSAAEIGLLGQPDGQLGAVMNVPSRDDVSECLKMFRLGRDLLLSVEMDDGETLIRLPLPNDDTFRATFDAVIDSVMGN